MKLTVLGSGTSSGIPIIGCPCAVCHSSEPKNKRLRSSCYIEADGKYFLIDTTPDLRQQALTHGIKRVDAVLYTHIHADHVHGIDELRMYNAWQEASIPIYADQYTIDHLTTAFRYIFNPSTPYPSLTPRLEANLVTGPFKHDGITVTPIPCQHGSYTILNYRIGKVAWLTDVSDISEDSLKLLEGLDYLFLDGLRHKPHPTHMHLEKSLGYARKISAKKTYLIHLAHDYDHHPFNKTLPDGIELAYDGLTVETD